MNLCPQLSELCKWNHTSLTSIAFLNAFHCRACQLRSIFLGAIEESHEPNKLSNLDSTIADGIGQLRDHFTANFRPTVPDFSLEVVCGNSFLLTLIGQDETLSCSLICERDVVAFKCSASVNGHVVTSNLFRTNLACPEETDSLPHLLSWVTFSEMFLQEIPIRVIHKLSSDFQSVKFDTRPT